MNLHEGSKPLKIRRYCGCVTWDEQHADSPGLQLFKETVIEMLKRADDASLSWPEAEALDDRQLKQRIYPAAGETTVKKPDPDYEYMNRS